MFRRGIFEVLEHDWESSCTGVAEDEFMYHASGKDDLQILVTLSRKVQTYSL